MIVSSGPQHLPVRATRVFAAWSRIYSRHRRVSRSADEWLHRVARLLVNRSKGTHFGGTSGGNMGTAQQLNRN